MSTNPKISQIFKLNVIGRAVSDIPFLISLFSSSLGFRGRGERETCDGRFTGGTEVLHKELSQTANLRLLVRPQIKTLKYLYSFLNCLGICQVPDYLTLEGVLR